MWRLLNSQRTHKGTGAVPGYFHPLDISHILKFPELCKTVPPSVAQVLSASAHRDSNTQTVTLARGHLSCGSCCNEYFKGQDLLEIPGGNFGHFSAWKVRARAARSEHSTTELLDRVSVLLGPTPDHKPKADDILGSGTPLWSCRWRQWRPRVSLHHVGVSHVGIEQNLETCLWQLHTYPSRPAESHGHRMNWESCSLKEKKLILHRIF